jgi:hypothetical protein
VILLNHHFFQVVRVSQIPVNALSDNITGIMESFKGILDQKYGPETSKKTVRYLTPF